MEALLNFLYANGLEMTVANRVGHSFASLLRLENMAVGFEFPGLSERCAFVLRHLCETIQADEMLPVPGIEANP